MVNYKYTDHHAAMKPLYRNKPLNKNDHCVKMIYIIESIDKEHDKLNQS